MSQYRYAIVGTGRPWKEPGATGFGMAHAHYKGFRATEKCDLVAVCDVERDRARLFLEEKQEPEARVYADYRELLAEQQPDVLSITLWPHLHAEVTIAACEAGVKAIHCEKPLATSLADARRMQAAAAANGTVLTFNHQRRFLEPFQRARQMLAEGAIGTLQRLEAQCPDMYDWGTHWLDMFSFYMDETAGEWVLAQLDRRSEHLIFGVALENQGLCHIRYQNGVRATLLTGTQCAEMGASNRLIGTHGVIEVGVNEVGVSETVALRVWGKGDTDWRVIATQEGIHGGEAIGRACADLLRALEEPEYRPMLCVDNALKSTEIIFAAYHSGLYGGRVDLPFESEENPFQAIQAGLAEHSS